MSARYGRMYLQDNRIKVTPGGAANTPGTAPGSRPRCTPSLPQSPPTPTVRMRPARRECAPGWLLRVWKLKH